MRMINSHSEFEQIERLVDEVVVRHRRFPSNVFSEQLKYYLFTPFDDLLSAKYMFESLKGYLRCIGEDRFLLIPIVPNPASYYLENFGIFNTWEFLIFDDGNSYVDSLRDYPEESEPDALMHNGQALLISSTTRKWAIYGERNANVAVCAFSSIEDMGSFGRSYNFEYLSDYQWAAKFAYREADDSEALETQFRRSYSSLR